MSSRKIHTSEVDVCAARAGSRTPAGLVRATVFAVLGALASAQEVAPPAPLAPPAQDAAQQEMRELFVKVERRLREIDKLLSDAGAGDTRKLEGVTGSGIDELLEKARTRQREVVDGIDRILEIARQFPNQSESGGGGSGEKPCPGTNPLDRQGEQSTQREETPVEPQKSGSEPGGKQPKPEPGEQGTKPSPPGGDGDTPRDPRGSRDKDPKNTPGKAPPAQPTDRTERAAEDRDRWGDLPVHARDVFRTEGGGDMPVQYRDWIDAYYKRLNKKP